MIILLLILAFLRTLQGAPLSSLTPTTFDGNSFLVRDASTGGTSAKNLRTTYGILQSCLLTIFACAWSSGHPNIAGPRDEGWTCLKRRLVTMFYALIAPEMVAYWALRQHIAANRISKDYNMEFSTFRVEPKADTSRRWFMALWDGLEDLFKAVRDGTKEWFTILPKNVARRRQGQPWTRTHGFFIQMGGFLLYDDEYPTRVLGYDDLVDLIRKKEIDTPTLTERDLQDRSKGDGISKGFVVLQTTWFVIQCITRLCQHHPLSELEVATLGFAALNMAIYAIWWNKPQGVGVAICIPLKMKKGVGMEGSGQTESIDRTGVGSECAGGSDSEGGTSVELQPMSDVDRDEEQGTGTAGQESHSPPTVDIPPDDMETARIIESEKSAAEEESPPPKKWLRRLLVYFLSPALLLLWVAMYCIYFFVRPLGRMMTDRAIPSGALRVPMFFADWRGDGGDSVGLKSDGGDGVVLSIASEGDDGMVNNLSSVIGTVFGAVHLLAWSSDFPSHTELLLWRISALIIVAEPVFLLVCNFFSKYKGKGGAGEGLFYAFGFCFFRVVPFYIIARLTLITLAFLSLRSLPPDVFVQISWTSFIPHL